MGLLTREAFREGVFARDGRRCVFCGEPADAAHHVMERRLFDDGGYRLDNGASVCADHHVACERTTVSVEEVRSAAGIETVVLPDHLYPDQPYTKWGDPVLPNGRRMRGELFFDESVRKVLAEGGMLHLYTSKVKYPRTWHLPWTGDASSDDKVMRDLSGFADREVVLLEKLDGANVTGPNPVSLEPGEPAVHGRSTDGYVMRVTDQIPYARFRHHVGKYVRPDHNGMSPHNLVGGRRPRNALRPEATALDAWRARP